MKKKQNDAKTFDIDEGIPYLMEKFDSRLNRMEAMQENINLF